MTERSASPADAISEILPHAERLPHTRTSLAMRGFFDRLTGVISWVWVVLMAVVMLNVLLRYLFGEGRVEFEEIQWHLYSIGFLLGISACLDSDDHVRVDVLRDRFGLRAQAWIELYGLLLLFFPFVALMAWYSIPFVEYAFTSGERSDAPGGLGMRWLIKAVIPLAMGLLALAGWGRLTRVTACLFNAPAPVSPEDRDVGQ